MAKQLLFNQTHSSGDGMGDGVVLWENPNPTASGGFSQTLIPIEDTLISSFKYIGVVWAFSTGSLETKYKTIWDVETLNSLTGSNGAPTGTIASSVTTAGETYCRRLSKGASGLNIYNGNRVGANGTLNTIVIPLQIIGYN